MKNYSKFHKIIVRSYYVVGFCMLMLLIYLGYCQKDDVFEKREAQGYEILTNVQYSEEKDDTAASGIRKEYTLELEGVKENNRCVAFYLVHHYVQVYVGEELVYSVMPQEGTRSETAGCRWVVIPVDSQDAGKIMRIETYPAYDDVSGRTTEFMEGSRYSIVLDVIENDFPEIALSIFAVLIGIAFVIIGVFCTFRRKTEDSLIYLGFLSVFLGMWKAVDTRSVTLLFPDHTLFLSVLPLGMLILAITSFVMFIERQIDKKRWKFLNPVCAGCVIVMAVQILLQITGLVDLRETLRLSHIMLAVTIVFVTQAIVGEWREKAQKKNKKAGITLLCFGLCALGAAGDMIFYYIKGTSAGILITIVIFVIYILIMGVMELMKLNHQANIDFSTGLFNKSRCTELINENENVEKGTCLVMFDLNYLKQVNDTMGHQAGDDMIYHFSDVLKRNIPASAFVGRYGGDEFLAVIGECSEERILKILKDISHAVEVYNQTDSAIKLSYAVGYVLSCEYPGMSMSQLLQKADYNMYLDKKKCHELRQ